MTQSYIQMALMPTEPYKTCPKCGISKPRTAFSIHRAKADGLQSWCKECISEHAATKYRENPAHVRDKIKRSIDRDPERRKRVEHNYYLRHRDEIDAKVDVEKRRVYARTHYHANKERVRRNNERYMARHPEMRRTIKSRRRARELGAAINDFTAADWRALLTEYDNRCAYCGCASDPLTQDHVIPLSRSGNHTKSNIVPACKSCNSSKGGKTPAEWHGPPAGGWR